MSQMPPTPEDAAADRLGPFFDGLRAEVEPIESRIGSEQEALRRRAEEQLTAFFSGLEPALEVGRDAQAELDRRLATKWTVFRDFFHFIHKRENTLSRIFRTLLDPVGDHGQGPKFLNALLDEIRDSVPASDTVAAVPLPTSHSDCAIRTEYPIPHGSIDIVIEWPRSDYRIGIENKPWAAEQRGQIKRYFGALLARGKTPADSYEAIGHVLVLYFSGNGTDPTTLPDDIEERKRIEKRKRCITVPYRTMPTCPSVEGWLRRCRAVCDAERIRWFLAEIEHYIQTDPSFDIIETDPASDEEDPHGPESSS